MAYTTGGRRPMRQQMQLDGGFQQLTISGTLQLDDASANHLLVNGGLADREIRMPASAKNGVYFKITNTGGTNVLQLRTSTGGNVDGFSPASATNQLGVGETALVACIDGTWGHTGVYAVTL